MRSFNSAQLKWIAMITMLIDHIGAAFLEQGYFHSSSNWMAIDRILRMIGRISFPLYCFLLVEAFIHTRNRKKYLCSLSVMALITEPFFDFAFFGSWYPGYQNVLFTLGIGFILMSCLDALKGKIENEFAASFVNVLIIFILAYVTVLLKTDYSYKGIILISIFYLFRANVHRTTKCILGGIIFMDRITALFAFLLIYLYNGKKGNLRIPHWMYRYFYPIHLAVLAGIKMIL